MLQLSDGTQCFTVNNVQPLLTLTSRLHRSKALPLPPSTPCLSYPFTATCFSLLFSKNRTPCTGQTDGLSTEMGRLVGRQVHWNQMLVLNARSIHIDWLKNKKNSLARPHTHMHTHTSSRTISWAARANLSLSASIDSTPSHHTTLPVIHYLWAHTAIVARCVISDATTVHYITANAMQRPPA